MARGAESAWLRQRVGEVRSARYLRLASGSPAEAMRWYRLDVDLRDALRPELEAVEVALRTRYHDVMTELRPGPPVWLLDPALPARAALAKDWEKEHAALVEGRCSADAVVDRVSFGFWLRLTSGRHEQTMWVPYLRRAYTGRPARREVHRALQATVDLRNRVHHYDTVVDVPVGQLMNGILWLLDRLAPDIAIERRYQTRVPVLLSQINMGNVNADD